MDNNTSPNRSKVFPLSANSTIQEIERILITQKENTDKLLSALQEQKAQTESLREKLEIELADLIARHPKSLGESIPCIQSLEQQACNQLQVQQEMLEKQAENLESIAVDIRKTFREIRASRNESYRKKMYRGLTERAALVEDFAKIMNDGVQFEEKFRRLTRNLDKESLKTVETILCRMSKLLDGNKALQDFFTEEEQRELTRLHHQFETKILKISDTLYCYEDIFLPVNQFDASVFYSRYGLENVEQLEAVRQKDIIDAGGYIGDTAVLFSPLTDKKVYVFEASPANFDTIQQTIKLNHLENIITENLALADRSGSIRFSLGERPSCNTLVERPGYVYPEHIEVGAVTLDEYVESHHLDVGLIKVDVEGGEWLLLQGALRTIRKFKPVLLLSIYHSAHDFFEIKPFLEDLGLGYKFKVFKPINNAIAVETILIAETEE